MTEPPTPEERSAAAEVQAHYEMTLKSVADLIEKAVQNRDADVIDKLGRHRLDLMLRLEGVILNVGRGNGGTPTEPRVLTPNDRMAAAQVHQTCTVALNDVAERIAQAAANRDPAVIQALCRHRMDLLTRLEASMFNPVAWKLGWQDG